MPSGKRARQQRRQAAATPPPVRSKGTPGARQASPRVLAGAGIVLVLVIVAVVLGIVLTKGGNGSSSTKSATQGVPKIGSHKWVGALSGADEVANLFKAIP